MSNKQFKTIVALFVLVIAIQIIGGIYIINSNNTTLVDTMTAWEVCINQ